MAGVVDCPACSRDTPAGAGTCRHCGADIPPSYAEPADKKGFLERLPMILGLIALAALLKLCVIGASG